METERASMPTNGRIRQGLRSEPSLEGGLRFSRGCGGEGGIALVLVLFLCRVGGAGATNWAVAGGGRVPRA